MQQRLIASLVLLCAAPAALVEAQTVFVTTVSDAVDFGGAKTVADLPGPDGKVSVREAVTAANNTAGPQTIGFQVPMGSWGTGTTGPKFINAGLSFVLNDDATTVDGTTQTAFTGDTNPSGAEVSFHSTTADVDLIQTGIFQVNGDGCHLTGLGDMTGRNYGIDIQPASEDNRVTACTIKAVFVAVRVQGDDNTIGGTAPGQGNRLDSLSDGLRIQGLGADPAQGNLVFGNALTGDFNGVQIVGNATANQVGGFGPGEANLIAGAGYLQEDGTPDGAMVRIETDSHGNRVLGNLIGTDAAGTAAADNLGDVGVEIYGDENEVRGNVIGGITGLAGFLSIQAGVSLREGAERNVIQGNWIGTDKTGLIPIPNRIGVQISAFDASLPQPGDNTIGGLLTGGNVIAFNEEGGVHVLLDTVGNRILGNEIRDGQTGIGIDLGGDGPTPNDPGDTDTGPNALMNFPVISSAVGGAQGTVVVGHIDTAAFLSAGIQLFSNPVPGGGATAQAETLIGQGFPQGGAGGLFALAVPGDATGLALTATATDPLGNTSEISGHTVAVATPWVDLGFGLAGTFGVPELQGGGTLVPGTKIAFVLSGALDIAPGAFVLSTTSTPLSIFGGTLVPSPQVIVPFVTDAFGKMALIVTWPVVPAGTPLYAQAGLLDPAGPMGVAISNAVRGTTP